MRPINAPFVAPLLLALAGCAAERSPAPMEDDDAATKQSSPPVSAPASASASAPDDSEVTMRYTCDNDVHVDILRDGIARVALPDGRVVKLSRIAGSTPPVFTGEALYFSIGDEQASLSQDEGTELACRGQ